MTPAPKIVVDDAIPYAEPAFAGLGQLTRIPGRDIGPADVKDADALVVRTVTRVDSALLENTRVRFVGSCTIGTDHLDTTWLQQRGIHWCYAPGCNANAVAEYVLAGIAALDGVLPALLAGTARVGLMGFGNVGSRVYQRLRALGIDCIAHDPLLPAGACPVPASMDEVLACDVVSLHVPLTDTGPFPTRHLYSTDILAQLPRGGVLINTSRGAVLSNQSVLALCDSRPDLRLILDVWDGEPDVDSRAIAHTELGTPHIAGYSREGKLAGTTAVMQQLARFIGAPVPELAETDHRGGTTLTLSGPQALERALFLQRLLRSLYDIRADHAAFRQQSLEGRPGWFEGLRRAYRPRREWAGVAVSADSEEVQALLDQNWPAVIGAVAP